MKLYCRTCLASETTKGHQYQEMILIRSGYASYTVACPICATYHVFLDMDYPGWPTIVQNHEEFEKLHEAARKEKEKRIKEDEELIIFMQGLAVQSEPVPTYVGADEPTTIPRGGQAG